MVWYPMHSDTIPLHAALSGTLQIEDLNPENIFFFIAPIICWFSIVVFKPPGEM